MRTPTREEALGPNALIKEEFIRAFKDDSKVDIEFKFYDNRFFAVHVSHPKWGRHTYTFILVTRENIRWNCALRFVKSFPFITLRGKRCTYDLKVRQVDMNEITNAINICRRELGYAVKR